MNIEHIERRQAISSWRDEAIFAALRLVNKAGKVALETFLTKMTSAGVLDTFWSREAFVNLRLDEAMREALAAGANELLSELAKELEAIHPDYGKLAGALASSASQIVLPMIAEMAEREDIVPAESAAVAAPAEASGSRFETVKEWAGWAGDVIRDSARSTGDIIWDKTGLYEKLHKTALERFNSAWAGTSADPRSYMGQIISLIDDAGNGARSATL